jgi:hypothetical protein
MLRIEKHLKAEEHPLAFCAFLQAMHQNPESCANEGCWVSLFYGLGKMLSIKGQTSPGSQVARYQKAICR